MSGKGELLGGRDVVIVSSIDWSDLWQSHQDIATRLARDGSRVFYVENTGIRAPRLRDYARVTRRARRWFHARRSAGVHHPIMRVSVISPVVMPPFGSRLRRALNRRMFVERIARALDRHDVRDPVIWTYLPTDTALDLCDRLRTPGSTLVYYCIADFGHLASSKRVDRTERELVERASIVFANGEELAERFQRSNAHVRVFPVGVNLDAFAAGVPVAEKVRDLPRPRIGCIGELNRIKSDFAFITALARLRPSWSWIFVGPAEPHAEFRTLPNIHLVDKVPHSEVASYIEGFDVCIVPYRDNEFMKTAVPTKINEYLAMEKPVVATPSSYARELAAEEAIVLAPHDPEAFVAAIESCLVEGDAERQASRRRLFASRADWNDRLAQMCALIRERASR